MDPECQALTQNRLVQMYQTILRDSLIIREALPVAAVCAGKKRTPDPGGGRCFFLDDYMFCAI